MVQPSRWCGRAVTLSLAGGVLLGGCGRQEESLEPTPPPALSTIALQPASADLAVVSPWNKLQLHVAARTESGAPLLNPGTATFASANPAVASVGSDGVVTAVSPGTAEITATLTLGEVTRTASMVATVRAADPMPADPGDTLDLGVLYDLVAVITNSDPAWGIPDGTTQLAVLRIVQTAGTPLLTGTFTGLHTSDADSAYGTSGRIGGSLSPDGAVVLELFFSPGSASASWHGEGVLDSAGITGTYGCCGHISGTFTARRRAP